MRFFLIQNNRVSLTATSYCTLVGRGCSGGWVGGGGGGGGGGYPRISHDRLLGLEVCSVSFSNVTLSNNKIPHGLFLSGKAQLADAYLQLQS